MIITPRNWETFQHYKDRNPPWIRLYKSLLDNFEFHCLPVASKALAPLLWLLASEHSNGRITAQSKKIAFRLHMSVEDFLAALKPLCDEGFFTTEEDVASTVPAARKQLAVPETETEKTEAERSTDIDSTVSLRSSVKSISPSIAFALSGESDSKKSVSKKKRTVKPPERFEEFYDAYPRHTGRGAAEKAWVRARKTAQADQIIAGAKRYASERSGEDATYTAHPSTWLNQQRWLDEPAKPNGNGHGMSPELAEAMRAIQSNEGEERENLKRMGIIDVCG